jgi:hypothetical protein
MGFRVRSWRVDHRDIAFRTVEIRDLVLPLPTLLSPLPGNTDFHSLFIVESPMADPAW